MDYGTIQSDFWYRFRKHSSADRDVAAYLLTCSHRSGIGCYYLPLFTIAGELSKSIDEVKTIITESLPQSFVKYCFETDFIYLPNTIKKNKEILFKNPNVVKKRLSELGSVPKEFKYFKELIQSINDYGNHLPNDWENDFEIGKVRVRLGKSKSKVRNNGDKSPDEKIKAEKLFDQFWQAYPKKSGRADALKKWLQFSCQNQFDLIMADVELKKEHKWNMGGTYGEFRPDPPDGSTYVNKKRWEDGYTAPEKKPTQSKRKRPTGTDVGQFERKTA